MSDLRTLRIKAMLDIKELSEQVGVSRQAISFWELGVQKPKMHNMRKLAQALDVSGEELWAAIEAAAAKRQTTRAS